MKSLPLAVLLLSLTLVASEDEEVICETCVKVNTTCYNMSYLTDLQAPFRNKVVIPKMLVMKSSNTLFYSFEPEITDEEYYKVGFINLDNYDVAGIIPPDRKQIYNFGSLDIDEDNDVLYLGGSSGVFSYNFRANNTLPYSSIGDTIIDLFYKGYVYFIRYGENKIIQKKGENFETYIPESEANVKKFVINKNYVTVYISDRGVFLYRNGETAQISKNAFIRGLTIDLDGNVYAWWIDGIYRVVIEKVLAKSKLIKVADMSTIGAMTFDGMNNIIIASDRSLYKLQPTAQNTVC